MAISPRSFALRTALAPFSMLLLGIAGCSAGNDGPGAECANCGGIPGGGAGGAGPVFGSGGAIGATGGAIGATGGSLSIPNAGGSGNGAAPSEQNCVAAVQRGEGIPLDMFVIWDRSGSMDDDVNGGTKWELALDAFEAFVNDPASAGIGVGLAYFPLFINGSGGGGRRDDENTVCDIPAYAQAAVPIAPLPGNAAAITASLNGEQTDGRTPTRVALAGAIEYAKGWATQHPDRKVVVVLQTDGEPNVCESTVQAVTDVAAAGVAATPSMVTYVIGVGEELRNLNQIAQAGGTGDAFIVDTAQDTTRQFIDAMNKIRASAAVSCEFVVPKEGSSGPIDFNKVNVTITPPGGAGQPLLKAANAGQCHPQTGGWYYDQPAAPTRVLLCPASCSTVKADTGMTVQLEIGCAARPITIR